jgi:hypothetical protein
LLAPTIAQEMPGPDFFWAQVSDPKGGMTYEEFEGGYRQVDPNADAATISGAFSEADADYNKVLSRREFFGMF